jgi:hypothetical protein
VSSLCPFLLLYLAAGVITLLIESRSPFRHWLRDRRNPDNLIALIEARDPRGKTLWYKIRALLLAPALASTAMVLLWPMALWWRFQRWQQERDLRRYRESRVFKVRKEHLQERLCIADIEQREIVHDPLGAAPELPFGHLHAIWCDVKSSIKPGDDIWSFGASWDDDWGRPQVREGYVVWRCDRPMAHMLSVFRPLSNEADDSKSTRRDEISGQGDIKLPDFLWRQVD